VDDDSFPLYVAGRLAGLPGVEAVTLGGSRAEGTHRPDSDWDFSIYYRGRFDPQALRDIGWPGEVFEVGGWSKGVFNGGAWLEIDGRKTDVHYRDLDVRVDDLIAAAGPDPAVLRPRRRLPVHLRGRTAGNLYLVRAMPELAADNLDSHPGGARTLTSSGRTGPATRESA
jgi:Nucleotidyltransferase domain